jgi:hypothetical protein
VQQELLVRSVPPHVNGKALKLIHQGLLVLGLVEVRPALCILFVDRNHLVLARRKLAVLPVDSFLLGAVASILQNLLHPLYSCKLTLVVGHEIASVAHSVVEVSFGSDATLKLLLTDEGITVICFHFKSIIILMEDSELDD